MIRRILIAVTVSFVAIPAVAILANAPPVKSSDDAVTVTANDWPWWRGPQRNGIAAAGQNPPLKWSESENVLWSSPVPGRGHGSPTVVGKQIFLATADHTADVQSVICYDRKSGRQMWKTDIHRGGLATKGNGKSSQASSSVACDGKRVIINFLNNGAIYTTALDLTGKQLWQTKISDYVVHQGFGSSPTIYKSLVIVAADNKGGGAIVALNRATGDVVWKIKRPETPNYSSPIVLHVAGRDQLLLTGCNLVSGVDPVTGKKLWEVEGATTECVTSTVTDGKLIITSGGYPKNHLAAVRADGSGEVVWENKTRVYVPSVLISNGHLYAVTDAGVAICYKADSGEVLWKHRLGGTFSSSPVLVGDKIFVTNENGRTFIYKAQPDSFVAIAENQLGDHVIATPAFCGDRIYTRVAKGKGKNRQEILYCLGK